jgi:flavin-binding protein dodecin
MLMLITRPQGDQTFGGPMKLFYGQSPDSIDAAIQAAVQAAKDELPGAMLDWLELAEVRGGFDNNILQYQIAIRIGYSPAA